jgi:hypothetical protein
MLMSTTYEQTLNYDPNNPNQVIREAWAPGGYTSYYFNRVPDAGHLNGLGFSFTGLPQWAQVGAVALASAVVGYFGYAKFGDKYIKPQLKKIGLAGGRRR